VRQSDNDDFDELIEPSEVIRVARVERQSGSTGRRSDQEVYDSRTSGLPPDTDDGCVYPPIRARRFTVEGQGIECRLCSLQPILATSTFVGVIRRVRASGQFREGDRTYSYLDRQHHRVESF
jgi:hypothetical protein